MTDDSQTLSPSQSQVILDWLESSDARTSDAIPGYQAAIRIYQGPAGAFAIKEPSGSWLRRTISRAAIRREAGIYRRLQGIPGIPKCFGCLDDLYLVLEHIPGDTLHALQNELMNREKFFAKLLETLRMMHDAGVAHGDLKRKKNILVGPDEQPFIIDFGIAVTINERRGFLFNLVKQVDRNAWIKHKYRGRIADIAAGDAALYKPMHSERIMRCLRFFWHAATLRNWRNRRRRSRHN